MKKRHSLIKLAAVLAAVLVILLPYPVAAATDTFSPNAAGDETLCILVGAATNWQASQTNDGDTTYVASENSNTYLTDLYELTDPTVSGKGKISNVTVYIKARAEGTANQASAYTRIKTNAVASNGTAVTLTTSYADWSTPYTTNPQTGLEWTWLEVKNLQAGVGLRRAKGGVLSRCTQVWVVVTYTAATLQSYRDVGHTIPWGDAVGQEYNATYQTAYLYGTNYIANHTYAVRYYDGSGVKVAADDKSSSGNDLSSQYALNTDPLADAGTWHTVVYDLDFTGTIPNAYADRVTHPGYMVEDSYEVLAGAIPEIPTVIAGVAVAGACFGIYYWMRKRRANRVC